MPPTPISLRKAAVLGFAASKTAGEDVGVGIESLEPIVIDLTATTDDEDVQNDMGMENGEKKEYLAFVLWWDANLVGVYCPFCLHLETHLVSSIAADSSGGGNLRQANCDISKAYRILYPYDEHPATEGCGVKCDETGHHETTGLGDILLPINDARDDDGFIDISEWDGGDIRDLGEGLDNQHVGGMQRSPQRNGSPSRRIPIAIQSDTEDDDLSLLSDSDDHDEENQAGRSKIGNEHREEDKSVIVIDNRRGRLPKVLHFDHGEQSPARFFSQEDRAPSASISEILAALPCQKSVPRVDYEDDQLGMEMKDGDRIIVDTGNDDGDSDGIAEIAASEWADRDEPSITASANGSSSLADPTPVSNSTSLPAIPSNVSSYLTLRPPNLKGRTILYRYMANIPSEGASTKTIGVSTIASSPSSTPTPALPFISNDITLTRSGYYGNTPDDPRILNNRIATAAVYAFCAEIGFPLKADNMDKNVGRMGQVYCSHVEKQLIVHAVLELRKEKSLHGGVRQSLEQSQTPEQPALDGEVTKWAIFVDREPCDHCNAFREAVEARFPLKFTFTTIQRAELLETEKKKKTRANRRLNGDEQLSMLPPHVPRTPKKPTQMVSTDSGYASAPKGQLDRSSLRKRRASSPCEMAGRKARRPRDRGLVREEWEEEFAATLVEDESEDAESADGDDEVQRVYEIRRREYE
jgi:hypothetical protein